MGMGLILSVEGLKRKQTEIPQGRGNSTFGLSLDLSCNINSLQISSLVAYPEDFGFTSSCKRTSQFLKINLSSYPYYNLIYLYLNPCLNLSSYLYL